MGRKRVIRSGLVKFRASGIDPKSGERVSWDVLLQRNSSDDKRKWRIMAEGAGFTDIRLERNNGANQTFTPEKAKVTRTGTFVMDADAAREALKRLDEILASRSTHS